MRFFDFGQQAQGVIAIGQEATGFIAIGQGALGVFAVGQLARGVFVVGQLAFGVFAVGQLSIGLWYALGMIGVAGRKARGIGIAIFPERDPAEALPRTVEPKDLTEQQSGWVRVRFSEERGQLRVEHGGEPFEVELDPKVARAGHQIAISRCPHGLVEVHVEERLADASHLGADYREQAPTEEVRVARDLIPIPEPQIRTARFWALLGLRSVALLVATVAWLAGVGAPLLDAFGVRVPIDF
jgi:hypothetical protein